MIQFQTQMHPNTCHASNRTSSWYNLISLISLAPGYGVKKIHGQQTSYSRKKAVLLFSCPSKAAKRASKSAGTLARPAAWYREHPQPSSLWNRTPTHANETTLLHKWQTCPPCCTFPLLIYTTREPFFFVVLG